MKKLFCVLTIAFMGFALIGCGKEKCSVDGCEEEVYKEGLCPDHYVDKGITETETEDVDNNIFLDRQRKSYEQLEKGLSELKGKTKNPATFNVLSVIVLDNDYDNTYYYIVEFSCSNDIGNDLSMYATMSYSENLGSFAIFTDENPPEFSSAPYEEHDRYYKVLNGRAEFSVTDEGDGVVSYEGKYGKIYVYEIDLNDYIDNGFLYVK